jgi:hypothetical protein
MPIVYGGMRESILIRMITAVYIDWEQVTGSIQQVEFKRSIGDSWEVNRGQEGLTSEP